MRGAAIRRPTREEIAAAAGKRVPDLIRPELDVLFCGINPGLYSGATGHHFARPGNRFWPVLHRAGFTERPMSPGEGSALLQAGIGITNLVERATAAADELSREELRDGAVRLERKVRRYRPRAVAVLGVSAFRVAFGRPKAVVGLQDERVGDALTFVLPNPSGRTAHYPTIESLLPLFEQVRRALA